MFGYTKVDIFEHHVLLIGFVHASVLQKWLTHTSPPTCRNFADRDSK